MCLNHHYFSSFAGTIVFSLLVDLNFQTEIDLPDIIDYSFITPVEERIADCNFVEAVVANHNFVVAVIATGINLITDIRLIVVKVLKKRAVEQASIVRIKPKDSKVHCLVQLVGINRNQFLMMGQC